MKAKALRVQSAEDLQRREAELQEEKFRLRLQQRSGQLKNPSTLRGVRQELARVKTIVGER